MAGKSEIEAGRAYVSLMLKDKGISKGLDAIGAKFKSIGKGISIFGAAVAGVGGLITAPLLAMAREFSNVGSALNDMSQRTGVSVSSLSELQFAAEQSGATLQDVEKAMRFMAKNGMNPQKFDEVAAKIASIEDPAKRAQVAMEKWGKAGTMLLPMAMDLANLRKEAQEAGITLDEGAGQRADKLGDAFDKLIAIIKAVRLTIGDVLSETITTAITSITNIAITVGKWVKQNKELFITALKIGTALIAAGTAIAAFGGIVTAIGSGIGAFSAILGTVVSVLGVLISPLGLAVAGLAGLAYWFATSTEYGKQMVQALVGWFGNLLDVARDTFGGIADAIAAGDLALAAKVAWAGLKVVWLSGTDYLRQKWQDFKDYFLKTTTELVFSAMHSWVEFKTGVTGLWTAMQNFSESVGEAIGHALTRSSDPSLAADQDRAHEQAKQRIADEGVAKMQAIEQNRQAELKSIDDASKAAADARSSEYRQALNDRLKALNDARDELNARRKEAQQERKDKELGKGPDFKPGDFNLNGDTLKTKVFGTFSAAAAMASGVGGSAPPDVKELREANKTWHRHLQATMEMRAHMKNVAAGLVAH